MIHVLLTSALPWQHNDAITVFTYFCITRYKELFFRVRSRELVLPLVASVVAKFEQVLWERFGNILNQGFEGHKNSE